jgi:hypothetical protein
MEPRKSSKLWWDRLYGWSEGVRPSEHSPSVSSPSYVRGAEKWRTESIPIRHAEWCKTQIFQAEDVLLEQPVPDPKSINTLVDTSILDGIKRYSNRIEHILAKDYNAALADIQAELEQIEREDAYYPDVVAKLRDGLAELVLLNRAEKVGGS